MAALGEEHRSLLGETDSRELCWLISTVRKNGVCVIVGKSRNFSMSESSLLISSEVIILAILQIHDKDDREVVLFMWVPWKLYIICTNVGIKMHVSL